MTLLPHEKILCPKCLSFKPVVRFVCAGDIPGTDGFIFGEHLAVQCGFCGYGPPETGGWYRIKTADAK